MPVSIKVATMSGVGLLLGIIGLQAAGVVVPHPTTLVTLGDLRSITVLLPLAGVIVIGALIARGWKGAILVGILAITLICWLFEITPRPDQLFAWPTLPRETAFAFSVAELFSAKLVLVVLAFLFVDIFNTAGALIGRWDACGAGRRHK